MPFFQLERFQILISLLLSSQTRDEVNYAACCRLREHGFTPEKLKDTDETAIEKILHPVGFYKTKAKNVRKVAQICFDKYDSDIPHSVADLCNLPGVGQLAETIFGVSSRIYRPDRSPSPYT